MVYVLRFKAGARMFHPAKPENLPPAGLRILGVLDRLCQVLQRDITITSVRDGDRLPTDPHPLGEAVDISLQGWSDAEILQAVTFCRSELPSQYFTVLFEVPPAAQYPTGHLLAPVQYVNAGASARHFHLQRKKGTVFPPKEDPSSTRTEVRV